MNHRLTHTMTALALAALSTLALAQVPARVGRIALAQGNVSIAGDVGAASEAALMNWPVTSHNTITTAQGARTELRIGSTSVRLDGDSSLSVEELDDDSLRLRLDYGSASVRLVDANALAGFELSTPQAQLRMREPGRMRIDVERQRDTTSVTVFDGLGLIDAAGGTLPVRAGKRADVVGDDIDTRVASRDSFDDWAYARDQSQDRSTSSRYVTPDMTGYEDLDRYGSWSQDSEYGALWMPQVDSSWVPYGDGRWTWLDPWGWTWVDNAPWGYAPFHYGRWVQVNQRWAWAPGRREGRPVWAPALVGWVGGEMAFGGRPRLSQGWYPLSPRDRFVPGYRASQDQVARLNFGPQRWGNDRRGNDQRDQPHRGLTVLPQDQFGQHGQVVVPRRRDGLGGVVGGAALAAMQPPRPPQAQHLGNRRDDDRGVNRVEYRGQPGQPGQFTAQAREPVTIATPPPRLPGTNTPRPPAMPVIPQPRQPVTILTPTPNVPGLNQQPAPPPRFEERRDRDGRGDGRFDGRNDGRFDGRNDGRFDGRNDGRNDERRGRPQFQPQPATQAPQPIMQPRPQPAIQPAVQPIARPAPPVQAPQDRGQHNEGGMAGMMRGAARDAARQAAPAAPAAAAAAAAAPAQPPHAAPPAAARPEGRPEGRQQQER